MNWESHRSDESFAGLFTGVQNFQTHLLLEKNLKVKKATIRKALSRLPEFSTTITKRYKHRRRHYSVSSSRELAEIDYAFFNKASEGFTGFICLIDAFNRFIYVEKIKDKSNKHLIEKYEALFNRSGPFNTGMSYLILVLHL